MNDFLMPHLRPNASSGCDVPGDGCDITCPSWRTGDGGGSRGGARERRRGGTGREAGTRPAAALRDSVEARPSILDTEALAGARRHPAGTATPASSGSATELSEEIGRHLGSSSTGRRSGGG